MSSTEAIAARLRALAQDHFEGRLSHSSYRRLRGPLLDSLVPGLPPLAAPAPKARPPAEDGMVTQPRANLRATGSFRTTDTQPREIARAPAASRVPPASASPPPRSTPASSAPPPAPEINRPAAPPQPRRGRGVWIAVAAVVVVSSAGGAFWYLRNSSGNATPAASTAEADIDSNKAYQLVATFVQDSDWSDARLVALNTELRTVEDDALATAADSPVYQRFVDDVRRRFKEQQALAAKPLVPENSPIAALAVTVGLDLHSPDSAVHIAPLADHDATRPAASATDTRPAARGETSRSARIDPDTASGAKAVAPPPAAVAATSADSASASHRPATTPPPANVSPEPSHTDAPAIAAAGSEPCRAALAATRRPRCQDALKTGGGLGPMLAVVPAGAFEMGNAAEAAERPVHRVSIGAPFAISVYEVSQAEYRTFCEHTGRSLPAQPWSGDDYPVVKVSWNDAQEYVRWLSAATGEHYRLPTEAEWEYAARAGVTGLFPSGDTLSPTDAWFSTAKQRIEMPARRSQQFNRNKFQLFHMVGNVREWVQDSWAAHYDGAPADGSARKADGAAHVVRGGAYVDSATKLRLTTRESVAASASDAVTGIRIVREVR